MEWTEKQPEKEGWYYVSFSGFDNILTVDLFEYKPGDELPDKYNEGLYIGPINPKCITRAKSQYCLVSGELPGIDIPIIRIKNNNLPMNEIEKGKRGF